MKEERGEFAPQETIEHFFLDNGLSVFLGGEKGFNSVGVELRVKAGSHQDPRGKEGLAHLLEHVVFEATEKWPTSRDLAKVLHRVGASYSGATDREETIFSIQVAPQHWRLALDFISQIINYPRLDKGQIRREKNSVSGEINRIRGDPERWAWKLLESRLFGGNHAGRLRVGTKSSLVRLTREDLSGFKESWYQAGNMSLAVVGLPGSLEAKRAIDEFFGNTTLGKGGEVTPLIVKPSRKQIFWQEELTKETHFAFGFLTGHTKNDQRKWVAEVLAAVLGGGMSSRLFNELRQRSKGYHVASFVASYSFGGYLAVQAAVESRRAAWAMERVEKEFQEIKRDLDSEEVEIAKGWLAGQLVLSMENPVVVAGYLNDRWLFENKQESPMAMIKEIEAVSFEDVLTMARQVFNPQDLRGVVIGPKF